MAEPPGIGPQRPWRVMVLVVIALILLMFAFALWSENEDLESLPAEQIERGEGPPE